MDSEMKCKVADLLYDIGKAIDIGDISGRQQLQDILDSNSAIEPMSDLESLKSDWQAVGSYIDFGLKKFSKEHGQER